LADHANIHLALVHFPVYNKAGEIVVSSVTTLDVHDISRICRTYSVGSFYVVTPLKTQQVLVGRIVDHWVKGFGAEYNPTRKESLLRTVVKNSLADVVSDIEARCGEKPLQTVTDARPFPGSVGYGDFSARLGAGQHLLIFGTGWGLERNLIKNADFVLAPIDGAEDYNHLPVRAAIAIILDRLLGRATNV
jgi:hypothetical protein